eukprot:TRINITY_DN5216_c1_g1_i1.p1 TRINITY_DN5216_c1_g1~~TRINITY_DN5216_c1_g1_i1.p1  ORF type:complete len:394 (+),score=113.08 TRINITY_DN5216_c1_g1_i1:103-1182(+)
MPAPPPSVELAPLTERQLAGQEPVIDAEMMKKVLSGVDVQCPQGCGEVMPFGYLAAHVNDGCPKTPLRCGSEGCGQVCTREEMETHQTGCPHRLVPCRFCSIEVKDCDKLMHEGWECPQRMLICGDCHRRYLHSASEDHSRECPGQRVSGDNWRLYKSPSPMEEHPDPKRQRLDSGSSCDTDSLTSSASLAPSSPQPDSEYIPGTPVPVTATVLPAKGDTAGGEVCSYGHSDGMCKTTYSALLFGALMFVVYLKLLGQRAEPAKAVGAVHIVVAVSVVLAICAQLRKLYLKPVKPLQEVVVPAAKSATPADALGHTFPAFRPISLQHSPASASKIPESESDEDNDAAVLTHSKNKNKWA